MNFASRRTASLAFFALWTFGGMSGAAFAESSHGAHAPSKTSGASPKKTASASAGEEGVDATTALARLKAGNERWATGKATHPAQTAARREELAGGQKPFAVILGCADSRVSPEILFDRGIGELFVVRVAGNTVDEALAGSVEYAVEHLGARLVVVLGHSACGAVKAAVGAATKGEYPEQPIYSVAAPILPAVAEVKGQSGDLVANAVAANARRQAKAVKEMCPVVDEKSKRGELKVVPAVYDLKSGKVTFL